MKPHPGLQVKNAASAEPRGQRTPTTYHGKSVAACRSSPKTRHSVKDRPVRLLLSFLFLAFVNLAAFAQPAGSDYERHILRKLEILRHDHAVFEAANRSQHSKVALTFTITKNGVATDLRVSPAISAELEAAIQRTMKRIKFDKPSRPLRLTLTLTLGT